MSDGRKILDPHPASPAYGYRKGCRCDDCREAARLEMTAKRRRRGVQPKRYVRAFWQSYIDVQPNGCWLWTAAKKSSGYSSWAGPEATTAHRAIYILTKGPLPADLHLDHLCRTRLCVNPDHLEPVTQAENNRRTWRDYTHCKHGHEFTPENTYIRPDGCRSCRTCTRIRMRKGNGVSK